MRHTGLQGSISMYPHWAWLIYIAARYSATELGFHFGTSELESTIRPPLVKSQLPPTQSSLSWRVSLGNVNPEIESCSA